MVRIDAYATRPRGISSRLRRAPGRQRVWTAPDGVRVSLPVILDHVGIDPDSGRLDWVVEATVDLVAGGPHLVRVVVTSNHGLDAVALQRYFRWSTPLDVVRRTVPQLIAAGQDPYAHHYAVDGYPDAADPARDERQQLSDDFLEEVVRQYLEIGRGYAAAIAFQRGVSTRTVVNWVHKARRRGILSEVRPGQFGGRLVPARERRGPPSR